MARSLRIFTKVSRSSTCWMPLRPREGPGLGGKGVMVNHFGDLQNWWEDEIILLLDLKMMVSDNDLFLRKKEWADVFGKVFFYCCWNCWDRLLRGGAWVGSIWEILGEPYAYHWEVWDNHTEVEGNDASLEALHVRSPGQMDHSKVIGIWENWDSAPGDPRKKPTTNS